MDEYVANNKNTIKYSDVEALTYSIWFHDAIYSPYPYATSSNEHESADLFQQWYLSCEDFNGDSFNKDFFHEVFYTILMTEKHLATIDDIRYKSTAIMLDIDIVGFARPFDLVMATSEQIFKEYACLGLPKKLMLENRIKFLEKLLSKNRIFYTEYFHEKYETIARENIEEVIIRSNFELSNL